MGRFQTTVCKSGVCKGLRRRNTASQAEKDMRKWMQAEAKRLKLRKRDAEVELRAFVTEVGTDEVLAEGEIRVGKGKRKAAPRRKRPAEASAE